MQWFTADFLHLASAFVSPRQVGKVHRHCFPYTCVFNPNQLWRHKIIKMLINKNIRRKNKCLHPVYCLFWGGSSSFNQPYPGNIISATDVYVRTVCLVLYPLPVRLHAITGTHSPLKISTRTTTHRDNNNNDDDNPARRKVRVVE